MHLSLLSRCLSGLGVYDSIRRYSASVYDFPRGVRGWLLPSLRNGSTAIVNRTVLRSRFKSCAIFVGVAPSDCFPRICPR
jgi:hypothetical protein